MHPAVLLLPPPLILAPIAVAFPSNDTGGNTLRTPARCGDLSITYPFTITGVQPQQCGFPAFELACDGGRAFLTRSYRERLYRVSSISYDTNSLVLAVEGTFAGNDTCPVPNFNLSSGLALFPLSISNTNKNLVFLYNCVLPQHQLFPGCLNHTIGAYASETRDGKGNPPQWVPGNCTSVIVPVRALQEGKNPARNYSRLISEGFLLEWPARDSRDCDACRQGGGECRFVQLSFQCRTTRGNG